MVAEPCRANRPRVLGGRRGLTRWRCGVPTRRGPGEVMLCNVMTLCIVMLYDTI